LHRSDVIHVFLQFERKDLAEAEMLQRKVLHAVEMVQGPKAISVAISMENLAETMLAAGKHTDASDLLQRYVPLYALYHGAPKACPSRSPHSVLLYPDAYA
jgi:hypothetical protein